MMAATNEAVEHAEVVMLVSIFGAITLQRGRDNRVQTTVIYFDLV